MKKLIALSVLLVMVASLFILTISAKPTAAAPCKPCSSWGQIKSCYGDKQDPCCDCGKSINNVYNDY